MHARNLYLDSPPAFDILAQHSPALRPQSVLPHTLAWVSNGLTCPRPSPTASSQTPSVDRPSTSTTHTHSGKSHHPSTSKSAKCLTLVLCRLRRVCRELTRALLKVDWQLDVQLKPDRLCPTVRPLFLSSLLSSLSCSVEKIES